MMNCKISRLLAAAAVSSAFFAIGCKDDAPGDGATLETEDGKVSVSAGKALDLPKNWPKDIPVPGDAKIQMKMEMPTGGHRVSFGSQKSVDEMAGYYQGEMEKLGWADSSVTDTGSGKMLSFKNGEGRTVMITATNSSGIVTAVTIIHSVQQ